MDIFSLDVETRPINGGGTYAALEPWRARQGKAEISSLAICGPNNLVTQIVNRDDSFLLQVKGLLRKLRNCRVFCHNAPFDVGWLITSLQPDKFRPVPEEVSHILWADTMTLVKWLINGQIPEDTKFSYSLVNLVATFLPDHPMTKRFIELKSKGYQAGENDDYWESRGQFDVILTRELALEMMCKVPGPMKTGLMTEWADIVPVANSWVNGIKIDVNKIEQVEQGLNDKMNEVTEVLGIAGTVFSSPKQLAKLLFTDWNLPPWSYTPTGAPSTSGDDIKWISYHLQEKDPVLAKKMNMVIQYKENKTLKSKYIDTLRSALSYTEDGYIYGVPKLFGTYTGRMTYSNSTTKDGPKVSIALHQLPRKAKNIRSLLTAPEGFTIIENDAAGQESRLMALRSQDPVMLEIFKNGLNFHSMTGAAIIGLDYHEFQEKFEAAKSGYFVEQRQLGKLTNLSCNYRIGGKALANKAFTEYDTFMTEDTGRFLVNTFSRQYAGIPVYWSEVIRMAKDLGYTEAFGGRRYKISKWDEKNRWMSESSAINMPIQGAGASMKEIAIAIMSRKMPEAIFSLDLHDAMFNYCPTEHKDEIFKDLQSCLNNIDYEEFWGFTPEIPLPYDGAIGRNFGEVK